MITTYHEAREYLESFIDAKSYHKILPSSGHPDALARTRHFLALLGDPHRSFPAVVVSGTSGKGSTAYLTANVLTAAGYRTGFTQSPHLERLSERFQTGVGGRLAEISDRDFIVLTNELAPAIQAMRTSAYGPPTYFEILIGMVLRYFAQQRVDIAVIEVGIEGKFDATNVVDPLVFVLTNLSLDHTAILGDTIAQIADEATYRIQELPPPAGRRPVVITGVTQPAIRQLIAARARATGARLLTLSADFSATHITPTATGLSFDYDDPALSLPGLKLGLQGHYQAQNAALAVRTTLSLEEFGFSVTQTHIRQALASSFFPGRFEARRVGGIECILDGAHNAAKLSNFLASLNEEYPHTKKVFVLALKQDKDAAALLSHVVRAADAVIVTKFTLSTDLGLHMGMAPQAIQAVASRGAASKLIIEDDPRQAFHRALDLARSLGGIVVVTGSLYLVGEIRSHTKVI